MILISMKRFLTYYLHFPDKSGQVVSVVRSSERALPRTMISSIYLRFLTSFGMTGIMLDKRGKGEKWRFFTKYILWNRYDLNRHFSPFPVIII